MPEEARLSLQPPVYLNYIGGQWSKASSNETYTTSNPSNIDEPIGRFQKSGREDVWRAIEAAAALKGWRETPPPLRGSILLEAWSLLKKRQEEFASTITLETGKTVTDSRGEVKRALNVLEFFAGEGRRLRGETIPSELPSNFIYTVRRPLGPVGIITPWNFPLAIPLWKIAPALVCGNTVVLKPATTTPLMALKIAELLKEAGAPPGVVNVVTGPGSVVGDELVQSPIIRAISFTGSTEAGSRIYAAGSKGLKRVQCEMGGKNAVVVLEDANLELAADAIIQGAFGFCGQRCTATSRVVVDRSIKQAFLEALLSRTERLRVGNPSDASVDMGPLASEAQYRKVAEYIDVGKREGAQVVYGGIKPSGRDYEKGYYLMPTVFTSVTPEMRVAQEEIFGPVLAVIECEGLKDAITKVNACEYGFKASIYTSDINKVMEFIRSVEVGMVHINAPTLGGEVQAPFGGIKASGAGWKEQGHAAIEFFSEEQVIYIDYTGKKREARFL